MAWRINVTAVRDCSNDEVRAVMSEVIRNACVGPDCPQVGDHLQLREQNGWIWFTTSVWGVSSTDLNRGLCKLSRPALQFTTSDGDRWYLTVHGGAGGQAFFLHEFGFHNYAPDPAEDSERQAYVDNRDEPLPVDARVAFLEDERPPGPDRPRAPFDLIADVLEGVGGRVPEEFRRSVAHLPYSQAARQYQEWHADQVSDAMAAAGIQFDRDKVRSVLMWENRSGCDDGDLGNLPWLLSALGLGGEWDDYVRNAESPPPEPEPDPEIDAEAVVETLPIPTEPVDHFGSVLAIVEPLELTPVAGGPFELPLDDLTLIRFFVEALSIHSTAGVVMTVAVPSGVPVPAPAGEGIGTVELTATGFRVAMDNHLWFSQRDLTNQLGEELAGQLYHLPNGSRIDVAFALDGHPALTHRYRGPVAGETWRIAETYPPLTRDALAEATDLARYWFTEPERHTLRDEAEAQAVVQMASEDPNLWSMKIQRRGREVWCKSDIVGHLPKVIFRHRFKDFWDVAAHDRLAGRQWQEHLEMQRKMRNAGAEAARRRAAPHDDDVLLDGKHGRYWRSDFTRLAELGQETRENVDTALADLGFRHVGDLVAKKQRDMVVRTYIAGDGRSYAVLMGKRTMYLGYEFFTRFADGSTLTTTPNASRNSHPEAGIYAKVCPGLDVPALHAKHIWAMDRFRMHRQTEPIALDGTLLGVVTELDAEFARRAAVGE